jgi:RNAse (barnase) inhibitor barstar
MSTLVRIDGRRITDADAFHSVFAEAFGFPDFYGRNMDAWIDCMTSVDEPSAGLSLVNVAVGEFLVLQVDHADLMKATARKQFDDLVECSAFVNRRRLERGQSAVLALSFYA